MTDILVSYSNRLQAVLRQLDFDAVQDLANSVQNAWGSGRVVYLCGNGGSAANAMHIANDLIYGADGDGGIGVRVQALTANTAIITCLGNDTGYDNIFAQQLRVLANPGDILIALSGSGNSSNILRALEAARDLGVKSYAVLGYSGGKAFALADVSIHVKVDDMQIAEDIQLIIGHMIMQWLVAHPPKTKLGSARRIADRLSELGSA